MIVSTYQSVSGRRHEGNPRAELRRPTAHVGRSRIPAPSKFAHPIIGNCIPHIDDFLPNGYTKEEMKMVNETRKIMGDPTIDVSPTCVRVPVPFSHSESILVETERPISVEEATAPLVERAGRDRGGRPARPAAIRWPPSPPARTTSSSAGFARTSTGPTALLFWCVSDNLRKGAATNAVQIAEKLLELVPVGSRRTE